MKKTLALLFVPLALLAIVETVNAIRYSESLYTTYKLIESAVLSDPKAIFKLREAFHPGVSERRWQVDGVQVIAIQLNLTFNPTNNSEVCRNKNTMITTYCQAFRWTNSYLLNLISGQVLEVMDPLVYTLIYSAIVPSSHKPERLIKLKNIIYINSSCVPSWSDFLSASALFLSWSKLYASENIGLPSQWHSKYQGYVARWQTYFTSDAYFPQLVAHNKQVLYTKLGLWVTFILLNVLIPIVFIRRCGCLSRAIALSRNKNIVRRICLVLSTINGIYLLAMLITHTKRHSPDMSTNKENPKIIKDVLIMLVAKAVILPTAILTELVTAIYTTRKTTRYAQACSSFWHTFILWQLFVFVQIWVGLVSIPLVIMALTSPANCILTLGLVILPLLLLTFIVVAIPCAKSCKDTVKTYWMVGLEHVLIAFLVIVAFSTYYIIVRSGVGMESLMGYVLSLIPTVPISILVWVIKGKVLKERFNMNKYKDGGLLTGVVVERRASSTTEEEIIHFSDESTDNANEKE